MSHKPTLSRAAYHRLADHINRWCAPRDPSTRSAGRDVRENAAFRYAIATIMARVTPDVPDELLLWAGTWVMHGKDTIARFNNGRAMRDLYPLAREASQLFGTLHTAHSLWRHTEQLTPDEALLHMAVFQTPNLFHAYHAGAICLMTVFRTQKEAIDHFNQNIES